MNWFKSNWFVFGIPLFTLFIWYTLELVNSSGVEKGRQQALDSFFDLCYTGAVVTKEDKVIGCWPMSDVSQEEKKKLDKPEKSWYNRDILYNF